MKIPVDITDKAFMEIMRIIERKNIPEKYGLRIGIKGAGCAGINYLLGFDTPTGDDGTFELKGLQICISKKHTMYLIGLKLDYHEGPDACGFVFSDPRHQLPG
jgi:iron-sulfur cluster assembly protein